VVLGRVVEVLTGLPWHRALRERLVAPLDLPTPVALAEEAIVFRAATGHLRDRGGGAPRLAETWQFAQATAPAGGTPAARARDLLAFARLHLDGGRARDGSALVPEATVASMQEVQAEVPSVRPGEELWGLGWSLYDWGGERVIGHGGATIGQTAELRIVPGHRLAVAMLMNAETSHPLVHAVETLVFGELGGVAVPPIPAPPDPPAAVVDPSRYEGTFERHGFRFEVARTGEALRMTFRFSGPLAEIYPDPEPQDLVAADERTFFVYDVDTDDRTPILFLGLEAGAPARALFGGRVAPRVGGGVGL
jgi:CubicO group peptidase (beta-lactamase class C family)